MKLLNVLVKTIAPMFFFVPLSMQDTSVKAQTPPITSPKQNPMPPMDQPEEKGLLQKLVKLTDEERNAAIRAKEFIKKYTDGKLHYGSVDNLMLGLTNDNNAIMQKAREKGIIAGVLTRRHLNGRTIFPRIGNKIEGKIQDTAYEGILKILNGLGVDPSTANKPDRPPKHRVTVTELIEFGENLKILQKKQEEILRILVPDATVRVIFPQGFSVEALDQVIAEELALPEGAELIITENKKGNGK